MKKPALVALLTGCALSAALTYPTIVRPGSMARMDLNDGRFSVWNVAWVAHALLDDPRHLFDANIFYPHRGALAYSEANLVAGALAVPVYALTRNPVAAHNSAVYIAMVLAFLAMWALVRRLTGSWTAALVSATGFTFAPYVGGKTAQIQLLMIFVLPVALLAWHRFTERPGWQRAMALGAALALAGLGCGYYGIYAGLAVGLGALWFAAGQSSQRRYWTGIAVALLVAAALIGPVLAPYLRLRAEAGARRSFNPVEAQTYSADARSYLTSAAPAHRPLLNIVGAGKEVLFPGGMMLLLAGVGLVSLRRRPKAVGAGFSRPDTGGPKAQNARTVSFYLVLACLAMWASFGPRAGLYSWLAETLPFMSFSRAPARMGVLVVFGVAVVAGFGAAALIRRGRPSLVAAGLVLLTTAELRTTWPLSPVPPLAEAYRVLATLPRGPVVEFHFPYIKEDLHQHAKFMFTSMWHWQPLINGYSDYIPPDFYDIVVPINGFPDGPSFRILRERDARYVVVHWASYNAEVEAIVRKKYDAYQPYLRPIVQRGDVWLYEIVAWPPEFPE